MSTFPRIVTFGCRLNTYESEVIRNHVRAGSHDETIIFNTCAVTSEAERQCRQAIRRARRENPNAAIIVTGCAVEVSREAFAGMPEITRIIANGNKLKQEEWLGDDHAIKDEVEFPSHLVTGFEGLARAFVQVQTGCDHRCTFCVIPFGRGPSRSIPIGEIVAQTRLLVGQGYKEIVLTGVDITSFGPDLPGTPTLGQMVRRLLRLVPECGRFRLSSLDPAEIDDDLWDLLANEPRLMPHVHLSVQSGDDMVLKRMKRRHGRGQALEICDRIRDLRPDAAIGADLIAGFPTETDGMHVNTMEFVDRAGLALLHVFPYSSRAGTPAAKMAAVPAPVIRARAAALRAAGQVRHDLFLAGRIGQVEEVLVEAPRLGRTAHYMEAVLPDGLRVGSVVRFTPAGIEDRKLIGHVG
jgi:threonylcarbamoyladenosine tRNA methylthiotransferase MtaB